MMVGVATTHGRRIWVLGVGGLKDIRSGHVRALQIQHHALRSKAKGTLVGTLSWVFQLTIRNRW